MKRKWVKITSSSNLAAATILIDLLKNEGLEVVSVNKTDSAHVHLGEIELMVPHDQVVVAKRIIQKAGS